jgi:SAM-dependent methyltransferase
MQTSPLKFCYHFFLMPAEAEILFSNDGYCPICRQSARFVASHEWLRDYYLCSRCGTCPRQRATVEVLNSVAPDWQAQSIHESSPCIDFFRKECPNYTLSYYFEDAPLGSMKDGQRCENLERLTFPDETFDIFLTQDVLEHVFRPDLAVREIARVLKPGGVHVFTAPKHKHLLKSYARAKQHPDGSVEHLLSPEYHSSPIGDGGCLVTWDYGADFDDLLSQWSGYLVCNFIIRDRARGIDGEYLDVFVMRKHPANQVPRPSGVTCAARTSKEGTWKARSLTKHWKAHTSLKGIWMACGFGKRTWKAHTSKERT